MPALLQLGGTLVEAGLAATVLERLVGRPWALDRWRTVAVFVLAALVAPALVGVGVVLAHKLVDDSSGSVATLWWTWAGPHALGILSVAPAVIGFRYAAAPMAGRHVPTAALAAIVTLLFVVGGTLLPGPSTAAFLLLLLGPVVGWAFLRASPGNMALVLLAIAAVVLAQATNDTGFLADARLAGQLLTGATVIVLLFLGAGWNPPAGTDTLDAASAQRQHDIRAAVVIAPILLFALVGWWAWFDVEAEAKARGDRKLSALVEHAHRVIEVQEAMLEAALARVAGRSADEIASDPRVTAFLDQLVATTDTSKTLFLSDLGSGRVLASSQVFPVARLDHSQREYMIIHRQQTLRTVIGEIGQALPHVAFGFTVSRLDSGSGRVAVSHLPLEEFERFYLQMREGDRDVMNLMRDDGALLARQAGQAATPGMRLPPQSVSMRLFRGELASPVVDRGILDGIPRLFHGRRIASYPVHVVYGQDYARIRGAWLRQLLPIGLLALLTSAMLHRLSYRLQRVAAEAEAARVAADAQRSLGELNDRLRFAIRTAGAGAWELEPGSDRATWSPECYALFGLDPADGVPTLSQWRKRFVHPDDLKRIERESAKIMDGSETSMRYDFRIIHPEHGLRWIATHGQLEQSAGQQMRLVGLSIDITDRKRVEDRLRESEERLRLSTEAAGIGTFSMDLLASRARYSPELADMLGFPGVHEAKLEDALARVHRDDIRRVRAELAAATEPASDGRLKMELRFVRPGGDVRWMTWNGRVDFQDLPQGRTAVRIVGACMDTTEGRQAEERLAASEARFRALVSLSSDWYWEQDEQFRFVDISDPVADLAGSTVGSHLGKTRWELPSIGVTAAQWAAHRALLEQHEPFRNFEYRRTNEQGEVIWMAVNGDPMFDAAGRFKGYRGTGHNITVRRKAEEGLRTSEARMRLAARAAGIGFWELDLATGQVRGSPEYFALFGLEATSEPVPVERISARYHPEDRAQLLAEGDAFGRPAARDRRVLLPDGRLRWVHVARDVMRDVAGKPVIRHGATIDITERKLAEQVLAEARAELERRVVERTADLEHEMLQREEAQAKLAQVQRLDAVGRLAGGLAHDFNNALAVISANIELAQPHIHDATARRGLQVALDVVAMSASLNRRLLTFTRGAKLNAERVDVGSHVRGIAGVLEKALGGIAVVTADLSPGMWPARLDPGELTSAILNLAINARDAMPEGGNLELGLHNVSLTAAELPPGCAAPPGDYVCLSMSDTGTGMAPEVAQRAIEPFYSTKDRASNSGLGLSSVVEFVRASAGFLTIDSEVGRGTTVSLFLPRFAGDDPASASDAAAAGPVPLGDGQLVLVIDDNERLLEATQALIEGLGYAVMTADNGTQALDLLAMGEPVDLVLSDIVMPGKLSGYDIARRLGTEYRDIKVVLASGHFDEQTPPNDTTAGAIRVLRKPYSRAVLARTLHAALVGSGQPGDVAGKRIADTPHGLDQRRLLE